MLFAQKEERSRQFSLALRAGLPILFLIFLLFYATRYQHETITINITYATLIAAITFITIYFIYFLINLSVKESLIDTTSQRFNPKAFATQLKNKKINTLALIKINNLEALSENYSPDQIDNLLYTLTQKLHLTFKQYGHKDIPIGKYHKSEFIIATQKHTVPTQTILEKILTEYKMIDSIELDLKFAIIDNSENNFEQAITQLHDIIQTQSIYKQNKNSMQTKDAKVLSEVEALIIDAIQNKKLHLQFRPLLNTKSRNVDIYETSVKLSSNKEDILPRVFLPIINRLGLGREYDFMLIEHIIKLLPLVDQKISFSFNLSPYSLRDHTFQDKVFRLIKGGKIDASRLIIQLYERKTHHDLSGYLETLKTFRRTGIRICIDNFGSSDASMEYMKHFKFDMVQFDRDYVSKLQDTTTLAILNSLINIAKELDISTIAKWVDNKTQEQKLTQLGIDYLQGFGIEKQLTEHELITYYN